MQPKKILIAEDEPLLLKVLEMRLKKEGYHVILSIDGKEALDQIILECPDLVIIDFMMPYYSGLEVLVEIRQQLKLSTPVIILSAMEQEDIKTNALNLGANDYILKPFNPGELLQRIKQLTG
ncbi:response regulator transcription factor [Arachidicoccus soli]|uniref:DNA-binding response regulator n=1 Tax=Arachidicoccus soli TaxID=2341117 RepID=A0A386HSD6_9BACT|nr:response regulator transcription factor [Arachidicoccus soli]AYD48857.1 DNA-binding response regulator [Arachidicoccus soli]